MTQSALQFIKSAADGGEEKKTPGLAQRMGQGALMVGLPAAAIGGTRINLKRTKGEDGKSKIERTRAWFGMGKKKPVVSFSKTRALKSGLGGAAAGAAGGALYHASEKSKSKAGQRIARGAAAGTVIPGVGTTVGALGGGLHHVGMTAKEYAENQRKAG